MLEPEVELAEIVVSLEGAERTTVLGSVGETPSVCGMVAVRVVVLLPISLGLPSLSVVHAERTGIAA